MAYPESADMCFTAAHMLLRAYTVGSNAKATIFWSWWTMSYRAFHAGAVMAFLAIREPRTERAKQCLVSNRVVVTGAKLPFVIHCRALTRRTRSRARSTCSRSVASLGTLRTLSKATSAAASSSCTNLLGSLQLRSLQRSNADDSTAIAQQQAASRPTSSSGGSGGHDRNRLSAHWAPGNPSHPSHIQIPPAIGFPPDFIYHPGTPLSQIRGFPDVRSPAPQSNSSGESARQPSPLLVPQPFQPPDALSIMGGDGFNGPETLALPQVSLESPSQAWSEGSSGRTCLESRWRITRRPSLCPRGRSGRACRCRLSRSRLEAGCTDFGEVRGACESQGNGI